MYLPLLNYILYDILNNLAFYFSIPCNKMRKKSYMKHCHPSLNITLNPQRASLSKLTRQCRYLGHCESVFLGVCDAGSEPELEGRGTQLRLSEDVQHVLPAMLSALTTTSIILFIQCSIYNKYQTIN